MVWLTDGPDMTLDVYRGRKTTIQQQQQLHPKPYAIYPWNFTGGCIILGLVNRKTTFAGCVLELSAREYIPYSVMVWSCQGHITLADMIFDLSALVKRIVFLP